MLSIPETHLSILLGGDGGLRLGEMIVLEWTDVDLGKRQMCIQRSDWNGHVTTPKNGRSGTFPSPSDWPRRSGSTDI